MDIENSDALLKYISMTKCKNGGYVIESFGFREKSFLFGGTLKACLEFIQEYMAD
jgi:hypothetical protein